MKCACMVREVVIWRKVNRLSVNFSFQKKKPKFTCHKKVEELHRTKNPLSIGRFLQIPSGINILCPTPPSVRIRLPCSSCSSIKPLLLAFLLIRLDLSGAWRRWSWKSTSPQGLLIHLGPCPMGLFQIDLWTRQYLFWSSEIWYWCWHFSQRWIPQLMVPEAKASHNLLVAGIRSVRVSPFAGSSATRLGESPSLCCRNLPGHLCPIVLCPTGISGWNPPWGPGFPNMRFLPAVCRRVHLFPGRLAVAGTPLKKTQFISPADPDLQVLSCLIFHARAELCAFLLLSDRTPSVPLKVLPEEPLSIPGSSPEDAQPRSVLVWTQTCC